MRGELIRGRRENHVRVELRVVGSVVLRCPGCRQETEHAHLELGLVSCGVCMEVRTA